MKIKKRHQFMVSFFRFGAKIYLGAKYHFHCKKNKLEKNKPYLILCNHTSNADPALLQLAFNRNINYIAHYELITSKIGKFLDWAFGIIPTMKGKTDLHTIREAMKVAKQNGVIGLYPSGDCTFSGIESPIDKSIVKFVRLLGIDTILYRTHGLYGVDPRFGNTIRKGKATGAIQRIIKAEEIEKLSDNELYEIIINNISVNHYNDLNGELFRSKKKAEYLERVLFMCPDCGSTSSMESHGSDLVCKKCGYKVSYKEDLHLELKNGKKEFETTLDWINYEKEELKNISKDGIIFSDDVKKVKVEEISKRKEKKYKKGHIELVNNSLIIKYGETIIECDLMKDIMIYHGKKRLVVYHDELVYNLVGYDRFSGIKYIYYQEMLKEASKE